MKKAVSVIASTFILLFAISACGGSSGDTSIHPNSHGENSHYEPTSGSKEVVSISASYNGNVIVGNNIDISKLQVRANYSDGNSSNVTSEASFYYFEQQVNINNFIFPEPNIYEFDVMYQGFMATLFITAEEPASQTYQLYFDGRGIFGYGSNGLVAKIGSIDHSLQLYNGVHSVNFNKPVGGNVTFAAMKGYEVVRSIATTIPTDGKDLFILDTLTSGHWEKNNNYVAPAISSFNFDYQGDIIYGYPLDSNLVKANIVYEDESRIDVSSALSYEVKRQSDSKFMAINASTKFNAPAFSLGSTIQLKALAFGYSSVDSVYIAKEVLYQTAYVKCVDNFDGEGALTVWAVEENGNAVEFEKVSGYDNLFSATVKQETSYTIKGRVPKIGPGGLPLYTRTSDYLSFSEDNDYALIFNPNNADTFKHILGKFDATHDYHLPDYDSKNGEWYDCLTNALAYEALTYYTDTGELIERLTVKQLNSYNYSYYYNYPYDEDHYYVTKDAAPYRQCHYFTANTAKTHIIRRINDSNFSKVITDEMVEMFENILNFGQLGQMMYFDNSAHFISDNNYYGTFDQDIHVGLVRFEDGVLKEYIYQNPENNKTYIFRISQLGNIELDKLYITIDYQVDSPWSNMGYRLFDSNNEIIKEETSQGEDWYFYYKHYFSYMYDDEVTPYDIQFFNADNPSQATAKYVVPSETSFYTLYRLPEDLYLHIDGSYNIEIYDIHWSY